MSISYAVFCLKKKNPLQPAQGHGGPHTVPPLGQADAGIHNGRIRAIQRLDFFFNDTATTEIYTLSLHDALPISSSRGGELDERHVVPEILEPIVLARLRRE